jgi:hypothetical protein
VHPPWAPPVHVSATGPEAGDLIAPAESIFFISSNFTNALAAMVL